MPHHWCASFIKGRKVSHVVVGDYLVPVSTTLINPAQHTCHPNEDTLSRKTYGEYLQSHSFSFGRIFKIEPWDGVLSNS